MRLVSVRQKEPLGLGHAVLVARQAVGDEPVAVLLGDDLYDCDGQRPAIGQLIDEYERLGGGKGVIALMEVPAGQEQLYGIVAGEPLPDAPRTLHIGDMVEKPAPGTAPSRLAIVGRYVLPAAIWDILERTAPGKGGEIQLTDALTRAGAARRRLLRRDRRRHAPRRRRQARLSRRQPRVGAQARRAAPRPAGADAPAARRAALRA